MFVHVQIETPINLTKKQKEILHEFDQSVRSGGTKHSPRSAGWLNGVKHFFEDLKFWAD